jgi:very-short-patch-repair endonuclease
MAVNPSALSTFQIDTILRRIAEQQLGLVTVVEATAAGVDDCALARRRESGALVPMFAEVMRLGAAPPSPTQSVLAASLAVPGSMVGATSAAFVHQMPLRPHDRDEQPVVVVEAHRSARTKGIVVVRTSHRLPSQPWFSTRVATPSATVLQLLRFVDGPTVERCLDYGIANRLTSVRAMSALIERFPPRAVPGRRIMLEMLAERSEGMGHRSRLEQTVGGWLNAADLSGWRRNHRASVVGGRSVEVDFAWVDARVALEVSPFFTHGSKRTQERDVERRKLLTVAGWRVIEATDPNLESRRAFAPVSAAIRALLRDSTGTSCAPSLAGRVGTHATSLRAVS